MKLITLNIRNYSLDQVNSFLKYISELQPDIFFLQEVKKNNLYDFKGYTRYLPYAYQELLSMGNLNGRHMMTVAYCRNENKAVNNQIDVGVYENRFVSITVSPISFLGVHVPAKLDENELNEWFSKVSQTVICGDYNASNHHMETINWKIRTDLLEKGYIDAWECGKRRRCAYYVDYNGEKVYTQKDIKTFYFGRHIDYVLYSKHMKKCKSVGIDLRTLSFTDHAAIIVEW